MRKRARHLLFPLAVTLVAAAAAVTASVAADSTSLPVTIPSTATPNINDASGNTVLAVTHVGTRIIVGGLFQSATNHGSPNTSFTRGNILAFDAATGLIDTGFAPVLDGEVYALMPGPTADTVYVAGQFSHVNGVNHFKIVELSTVTGAPVTTFKPLAPNGLVTDMALSHNHLIIGGTFTTIGNTPAVARGGLASMDPTTGALDSFVTVTLAGHHNWVPGSTGAMAGVGVERFDVSPDGNKLIVVGNFKTANGLSHDQGVLLDLSSGTAATVLPWFAPGLTAPCNSVGFDDWVRDVAFGQDGSYFVIVGTGSYRANTLCDSSERFDMSDSGNSASQPVWVDRTGGDTFLSVATTSAAIYVGGHFRWLNNSFGNQASAAGAVGRAGIAALDPKSGLPLAWNPGHHPRGFGIQALYVDPSGLYVGSDQDYFGAFTYQRAKIGFLPFAGGYTPPAGQVAALPAKIYQTGVATLLQPVLYRVDAGGPTVASTDSGPDWASDNGASSPFHGTGGSIASYATQVPSVNSSVPAGTPLQLFSSARFGATTTPFMKWTFPVPNGTPVTVRIYYADRSSPAFTAGQRVFSVTINSTVVEPAMDIVARYGADTAGMRAYQSVSNGSVSVTFTPSKDAPQLSAIEIRRANIATGSGIGARTYDGTNVGPMTSVGGADGTPWSNLRGAMLVDNELYYGMTDGNLYRRTFSGSTLGVASVVNPFSDPFWDTQGTGVDGTFYAGIKSSFYSEIPTLAAMYYDGNGKLYYTRTGLTGLYWRNFSPDTGVTGCDEFTVATANSFANPSGALFISGGNLYWSTTSGNLNRIGWTGSTTSGAATAVSGPGIDGKNWTTNGAFIGK